MVEVGVALPQMTEGVDRERILAWCRGIDAGPFSSVSAGERITFDNLDGHTLNSAAAALTDRVRVLFNVVVAPWHQPAMLAQQLGSLDVLSGGRLDVAVGVGGRAQDYRALASPFERRFARLDEAIAELRRLWAGGEALGGGVVGPAPLQPGGPAIFCTGTGPKSLARAARWADGLSGFAITGSATEADGQFRLTEDAWREAGRDVKPRLVTGVFAALGPDGREVLQTFARRYLSIFGADLAEALAANMPVYDDAALHHLLDGLDAIGCDELILVPASSDPDLLARFADAVGAWQDGRA